MTSKTITIGNLMHDSGVGFGTSGARGLVSAMTDQVCYAYSVAFLQYLADQDTLRTGAPVALAGDFRSSTGRILNAVARAVLDAGFQPIHCGRIPSPAVACYGLRNGIPSIMVTGSHIPDDRNGIKYNTPMGEILKADEQGIRRQSVELADDLFDAGGMFIDPGKHLPATDPSAYNGYVERYTGVFAADCLGGLHVGLYEHSSVAREIAGVILEALGARVTRLGFSDQFIPVDTEAIREEDVRLAREWATEHQFDAIVSTDGDGDRPLIAGHNGTWLRGDMLGILCARYLRADAVVTPVSSNTALEKSSLFTRTIRTRIGSPYVIEGMLQAIRDGSQRVVGYEANGGFLTGTDLELDGGILPALPTRDTLLVIIAILAGSRARQQPVTELFAALPPRYTASGRLKNFPTAQSRSRLTALTGGGDERSRQALETVFGKLFGPVRSMDQTDGLRITFENEEIVHLRPSGNAPEFRCYNEADSATRAEEMNRLCMAIMEEWRDQQEAPA